MKLRCFVAGLALGLGAVLSTIVPSISAECEWSSPKQVRGYCPEHYLREDIGEELVQKIRWRAFNEYFPLDIENKSKAVAWIRHHEEVSRNRALRGEFLIVFRHVDGKAVAERTAADGPMEVDLRKIMHGHRDKIAAAFATTDLAADSDAWTARVRELLPSEDELMRAMLPKRYVTSSADCPVLDSIVEEGLASGATPVKPRGQTTFSMYIHGRTFEVFVRGPMGRALYVLEHGPESPLFTWADTAYSKLEKCWKPKDGG